MENNLLCVFVTVGSRFRLNCVEIDSVLKHTFAKGYKIMFKIVLLPKKAYFTTHILILWIHLPSQTLTGSAA